MENYGERIAKLEEAVSTLDSTTLRLEGKVDALRDRMDERMDSLRDHIDEKLQSLEDRSRAQNNQRTTWLVGLPGTLYATVNLLRSFLGK